MVTTEDRTSRLEGAYEQVDRRLGDMLHAISTLREDTTNAISALREDTNSRFNELNSRINTLYVLLLASWVTNMAAIIGLYFRN